MESEIHPIYECRKPLNVKWYVGKLVTAKKVGGVGGVISAVFVTEVGVSNKLCLCPWWVGEPSILFVSFHQYGLCPK